MLTDLKDINECFKEFYSKIYTSKSATTHEDFDQFFDSLHFPKLDLAFRENLDLDFSLSESQDGIVKLCDNVMHSCNAVFLIFLYCYKNMKLR